jgi:hypothetical protein
MKWQKEALAWLQNISVDKNVNGMWQPMPPPGENSSMPFKDDELYRITPTYNKLHDELYTALIDKIIGTSSIGNDASDIKYALEDYIASNYVSAEAICMCKGQENCSKCKPELWFANNGTVLQQTMQSVQSDIPVYQAPILTPEQQNNELRAQQLAKEYEETIFGKQGVHTVVPTTNGKVSVINGLPVKELDFSQPMGYSSDFA